jgi:hypothetical protein
MEKQYLNETDLDFFIFEPMRLSNMIWDAVRMPTRSSIKSIVGDDLLDFIRDFFVDSSNVADDYLQEFIIQSLRIGK